jgi:hypothetical protein
MLILCDNCKYCPKQEGREPSYRNELRLTCGKGHPVIALRVNGLSEKKEVHGGLVRGNHQECPDHNAVWPPTRFERILEEE